MTYLPPLTIENTAVCLVFTNPDIPHNTCDCTVGPEPTGALLLWSVMSTKLGFPESMVTTVLTVYGHSGAM